MRVALRQALFDKGAITYTGQHPEHGYVEVGFIQWSEAHAKRKEWLVWMNCASDDVSNRCQLVKGENFWVERTMKNWLGSLDLDLQDGKIVEF